MSLPLGTSAPITRVSNAAGVKLFNAGSNTLSTTNTPLTGGYPVTGMLTNSTGQLSIDPNGGLIADLSTATAATINQLRQSFQIQKLLERDARGGTRYTEIIRAHFGVVSPDARLQRPEYLGGSSQLITMTPIPQTSGTGITGGSSPLGNLAGYNTVVSRSGFHQSFTEHGVII